MFCRRSGGTSVGAGEGLGVERGACAALVLVGAGVLAALVLTRTRNEGGASAPPLSTTAPAPTEHPRFPKIPLMKGQPGRIFVILTTDVIYTKLYS